MARAAAPLALLVLALRVRPALADPVVGAPDWDDDAGECDASDVDCALSLRQLRARSSAAEVGGHAPAPGSPADFAPLLERAGAPEGAGPMALMDTMTKKAPVIGYHQTSPHVCDLILKSQFRPGRTGWCGGAIYFADSIGGTYGEATGPDSKQGCILQATLNLGKVKEMPPTCDSSMNGAKLKAMGYDSIVFNDGAGTGNQYVLYDPSRISHVGKLWTSKDHAKKFAARMQAQAAMANISVTAADVEGDLAAEPADDE